MASEETKSETENQTEEDIEEEKEQPEEEKDEAPEKDSVDVSDCEDVQLGVSEDQNNSEDQFDDTNTCENIDDPERKILWAAENNELYVLRQLLEENPKLISAVDEDLYTPLHRACSNNHTEIIKLLLSCGAEISARTEDGWCPLHCACRWDSVEAASLLLQSGANINATSKGGLTPLHLAAANSSGRRTLELLLWHPHVDGSLKAENGDTAYDVAYRTSNTLLRLFELLDEPISCF